MERVLGIGGIFFKAKDPEGLKKWYEEYLGMPGSEWGTMFQDNGLITWSIFPADSDYYPGQLMINYRVANLDAMLEQLKKGGATIDKVEDSDYGRFAWATDPEGNRFELWQAAPEG